MIRLSTYQHELINLDFFPDSSRLVTIGDQCTAIWIWDLRNPGEPEKHFVESKEYGKIILDTNKVFVSSEAEMIFVTQRDLPDPNGIYNFLHFLDWENRTERTIALDGRIHYLRLAQERTTIVFEYDSPRWTKITQPVSWQKFVLNEFEGIPESWQYGFAHNSDNLDYFIVNRVGELAIVQLSTKRCIKWIPFEGSHMYGYQFSKANRYFVGIWTEQFTVFETESFQPIPHFRKTRKDDATPCFTPDERYILFGREGALRIVDIQTGEEVRCYDFGLHKITTMKISDDGLMVALAGANQQMVVVDLDL